MTLARAAAFLLLISLLTALAGWQAALHRPLTQDEVDPFAVQAAEVAREGPAALGERSAESRFPGGTAHEIPHPTLFVLLLSTAFAILGPGGFAARSLGLLFHLAALGLVWAIARRERASSRLDERSARTRIALALYLVLPIAIQYPLFTDIDNSVLPVLLLLQAILILRAADSPVLPNLLLFAAASALALWGKETTPLLLMFAGGIWWVLRRGLPDAFIRYVPAALAGLALFGITWGLFCAGTGVPFDAFYQFTIQQKLLQEGTGPAFGPGWRLLWNETQWIVSWFSLPFLALAAWAVLDRLARLARTRSAEALDLLLVFTLILLAVHGVYYPGLKYLFPALAPLCLLIGDAIARRFLVTGGEARLAELLATGAIAAAIAAGMILFAPDPVLPGWSIKREVFWTGFVPCAAGGAVLLLVTGRRFVRSAVLSLLAATLGLAFAQDLRQRAMEATVPSFGDYGERGAASLVARLDGALPESCRLLARRDIAFAAGDGAGKPDRRAIEAGLFRNEPPVARERLVEILADPGLAAVAFDDEEIRSRSEFTRDEAIGLAREAGFKREERFGDFLLLVR